MTEKISRKGFASIPVTAGVKAETSVNEQIKMAQHLESQTDAPAHISHKATLDSNLPPARCTTLLKQMNDAIAIVDDRSPSYVIRTRLEKMYEAFFADPANEAYRETLVKVQTGELKAKA